ncbi:dual specificity protein phosphatase 1 [Callorhinchus milii]|uniref:dual specificity protein phosphatase 1 n=1 Tax=Callorhinchus milii TaxID=7868 RepID=UPI00045750E6|nr:dual specificity protein phosphatase 1 [Callorhinchus milii]|eukprot:gi/632985806/ref/XP_007909888.1/ PREDICTED: dual specificity protein phosphatase 1 [Callorhinchus milii]
MVMMAVSAVDSVSLAHLLTEDPSRCLLLDCRSFFAFSASHVSGALNVRFCSIVRRRAKGAMGLEHVVPHEESRSRLLASHYTLVVVYDERTVEFESLKKDSTALLAANALCREQYGATIAYLRGGYDTFSAECPEFCTESLPPSGLSLSLSADSAHSAPVSCGTPLYDQGGPVEILPFLYLGSAFHASRRDMLDALGITALINVSATCPNHFEGHYLYKCIPVEDSHKADISCWFKEAIHFVDSVKNAGGRVFVHCQAGISRSATICLAYLMSSNRVRLDEAFEFVKQRRSVISPNFSFMGQLLQFEAQVLTPSCSAEAASPLKKPSGASSTQFVFNFPVSMPVCSAANSLGFLQPITASPTY